MPLSSKTIIKKLRAAGWEVVARKGSYVQLRHPGRGGRVTVPHPNHDLPKGTIRSIERQSGVELR